MSLHRITRFAGVSTSAVSRVVNEPPVVARDTVASVRHAIHLFSLGVGSGAWSLPLRAFAFPHAAEDAGAEAHVFETAVIDIHPEAIARRGVQQRIWRMRHPRVRERVRTMFDPSLIEPAGRTGRSGHPSRGLRVSQPTDRHL
jgi:hypothetical protein